MINCNFWPTETGNVDQRQQTSCTSCCWNNGINGLVRGTSICIYSTAGFTHCDTTGLSHGVGIKD